jgi:dynactin complex subunit
METSPQLTIGSRCRLNTGEAGWIAFKGPVDGKPGEFVGVFLDEPIGRNDGSVAGKSYFQGTDLVGLKANFYTNGEFLPFPFFSFSFFF